MAASTQPRAVDRGDRYFAEVVAGLEDLAAVEIGELGGTGIEPGDGGLRFVHRQPAAIAGAHAGALASAGMVAAVYRELRFAVPRPKALLGDEAARRLAAAVRNAAAPLARQHAPGPAMRSFRLAAAGSDSAVFRRLAAGIAASTGLVEDQVDGEMLIRVRPYHQGLDNGWEALIRLSPRPLSTRAWRVCNRPGGLNANVAVATNELVGLDPDGAYLNLMCGSGTLLVERALAAPHSRLVGLDSEQGALDCSATNLAAAGVGGVAELVHADVNEQGLAARLLELSGGAGFSAVVADVPWGDAVGTHAANRGLHETVARLASELLAPGGRCGIVSHEIRLLKQVFEDDRAWKTVSRRQVAHGGHNPVLLVVERV